tara:strand:- start:925 stop:2058 length:1134 start_codon:yes stop_codon:yes gene_type:complete
MLVFNEMISDARVIKEAKTLSENNYKVIILSFKNNDQNFFERKLKFLIIHIKFIFRKKPNLFLRIILLFEILFKMMKLLLRIKPDIIHCHDIQPIYVAWLATKILKCKLVYDSHELEYDRNISKSLKPINRFYEKLFINRADQIIVSDGKYRAKIMIEKSDCIKPITYIKNHFPYNGKINPKISLTDLLNLDTDQIVIIYVGNLMEGRGIQNILSILKKNSEISLAILGLNYKSLMSNFSDYQIVSSRIYFLDPVHFLEIPNYCFGAKFGLALIENVCLSYYYSLPTKLFDYIASGVPILASNFPGIKEVVEDNLIGPIGVCVNPLDLEDTLSGVEKILNKENNLYFKKNIELVHKRLFNWEIQEKKLINLYSELLR